MLATAECRKFYISIHAVFCAFNCRSLNHVAASTNKWTTLHNVLTI